MQQYRTGNRNFQASQSKTFVHVNSLSISVKGLRVTTTKTVLTVHFHFLQSSFHVAEYSVWLQHITNRNFQFLIPNINSLSVKAKRLHVTATETILSEYSYIPCFLCVGFLFDHFIDHANFSKYNINNAIVRRILWFHTILFLQMESIRCGDSDTIGGRHRIGGSRVQDHSH